MEAEASVKKGWVVASIILLCLPIVALVSLQYLQYPGVQTSAPLESAIGEQDAQQLSQDPPIVEINTAPETALEKLLAVEWSNEQFKDEPIVAAVTTREGFANAASRSLDMRKKMLESAYPAPLDEQGHYIVLNNNRFYSMSSDAENPFNRARIFLHYPEITESDAPPVVKVTPYLVASPQSRVTASHTSGSSIAVDVQVRAAEQGLILGVDGIPFAQPNIAGGEWVLHVSAHHHLAVSPRRYFVLFE